MEILSVYCRICQEAGCILPGTVDATSRQPDGGGTEEGRRRDAPPSQGRAAMLRDDVPWWTPRPGPTTRFPGPPRRRRALVRFQRRKRFFLCRERGPRGAGRASQRRVPTPGVTPRGPVAESGDRGSAADATTERAGRALCPSGRACVARVTSSRTYVSRRRRRQDRRRPEPLPAPSWWRLRRRTRLARPASGPRCPSILSVVCRCSAAHSHSGLL